MRCSKRKEILTEKRRKETERSKQTYAGISSNATTHARHTITQGPSYTAPTITREETLKINICIARAHYMNIENPGTYEEELNKILTLNKLPSIKIPSNPNSKKILSKTSKQPEDKPVEAPHAKPRKYRERRNSTRSVKEANNEEIEKELVEMEQELLPNDSKEIGLKIYTTEERG